MSFSHGTWSFDSRDKTHTFANDIESLENRRFDRFEPRDPLDPNDSNDSNDPNYLSASDLDDFRRAALIHKVACKKALGCLYSGGKLAVLVDTVEHIINVLSKTHCDTGIAFPVGVNINNVVAHDSKTHLIPEHRVFCQGDVVKVDIGVHCNGRIIDSAFTHIVTDEPAVRSADSIYLPCLEASRDSMFTAIKMAGADQRLVEISETISEIIQSYEVSLGSNALPIKPIIGIGGHNIARYKVHGGKLVLSDPDPEIQGDQRMDENEVYAIETYASTGYGVMTQNDSLDRCTHYMETPAVDVCANKAITKKDKKAFRKTDLYKWIESRGGLPFSSAWLVDVPKVARALKQAIPSGQITAYPPLYDEENSVVAQFEHTIHLKPNGVEIFSLDTDY